MIKRIIIFLSICILLLLTSYFYFRFTVHPVVENKIYRSAQLSGNNLQKNITEHKFKSIVNLRGKDTKEPWYQTEAEIAKRNNVKLYNVRFSAYKLPVSSELDALIQILQTVNKPILLHCQAGADRSGMASAVALSIEKDASLLEMKKQFSWRYFVNPFRKQTSGKLLFSSYENFLNKKGIHHNRTVLLSWIENEYVDYKGNIEFVIERANNKRFDHSRNEDRRSVFIEKGRNNIVLEGWAFDYRRKLPVKYLNISIGNITESLANFTMNRSGVATHYDLNKHDFKDFKFGWTALMNIGELDKGCYPISLHVGHARGPNRRIMDTGYDLCIE